MSEKPQSSAKGSTAERPRRGRRPEVAVAAVPRMAERYDPGNNLPADAVGVRSVHVCLWRCPAGPDHLYEARADAVFQSARGACPFCAGRQPSVTNRLDILHEEIAAEWDTEANAGPPSVVATANRKAWWRCSSCDHRWEAKVNRRTRDGSGCPRCAWKKNATAMSGKSQGPKLRVMVSDVALMAQRYDPANALPADKVSAHSSKVYRWRCPVGWDHVYEAQAASVFVSPHGRCPCCAGRQPSVTNRLDILHEEIAAEWDTEANGGPPIVVATSKQKASWRCAVCDYRWETSVYQRTVMGRGCRLCAQRANGAARSKPRPGRSLTEIAPTVAAQWHPTKNAPLRPEDIAAFSSKPRWWQCADGHEWEAVPSDRAGEKGSRCPVCTGHVATATTSLAAMYQEVAEEWHPTLNGKLTPHLVLPGSAKKVWWLCPQGHDYDSTVSNRTTHGGQCPFCSGRRVGYGNDLATLAQEVAEEWDYEKNHPVKPTEVTLGGAAKYWWLCKEGHSWETTVPSRVRLGTGCPRCVSYWRRSRPEIALQHELAHVLPAPMVGDAKVRTTGSTWHVDVLCMDLRIVVEYDGHYWHQDKLDRDTTKTLDLATDGWLVVRVRQVPLPTVGPWDVACEGKEPDAYTMTAQVLSSLLDAAAAAPADHPAHARLDALRTRVSVYLAAGVAQASEETDRVLAERRIKKLGPPPAELPHATLPKGPPRPKPGRSLAEKSEEMAAEWHPELNGELTAWEVSSGRNAKAWWLCSLCGQAWEASINHRTQSQILGCPDCARSRWSKPAPGQSLIDLFPEIAAEWHPTKNHPLGSEDVKPNSTQRVWWQCSLCGQDWETTCNTRMRRKNIGCPDCGRAQTAAKRSTPKSGQSLFDLHSTVAAQWHPSKNHPLTPEDVKPGSNKSVWWCCKDGHEWQAGIYDRTKSKNPTGCPDCWRSRRIHSSDTLLGLPHR
ncbi:zinc-ribbon domain-containing protein [Kocuria rosea]|uniref:DUF559 domain-containing protein n=1 Tax=Kocuria rosea TaxID=1275 RepID=A0A4R5YMS2_KOCRO|nr:DUF559 domain-containing protein [Kocuria rosea]